MLSLSLSAAGVGVKLLGRVLLCVCLQCLCHVLYSSEMCQQDMSWWMHFSVNKCCIVRSGHRHSKRCAHVVISGSALHICKSLHDLGITFDMN